MELSFNNCPSAERKCRICTANSSATVTGQSVTASNAADFGVGALLLAASELTRLLDITSGINNLTDKPDNIKMYPNPASTNLTIGSKPGITGDIELFDLTGNLLKSKTIEEEKNIMDTSTFGPGIYIIKTNNETIKVIKD